MVFALSDATRRDIVIQTLDRERSVSELGRLYPISLTAVQKHVEVLVDAGLVSKHRSGREQLVRGEVNQLRRAHELLDELEAVWRARLERFEDVLNETAGRKANDCIEAAGEVTRMILTTHFDSLAGMEQAITTGVAEGMKACMSQIDTLLAEVAA